MNEKEKNDLARPTLTNLDMLYRSLKQAYKDFDNLNADHNILQNIQNTLASIEQSIKTRIWQLFKTDILALQQELSTVGYDRYDEQTEEEATEQ